MVVNAVQQRRRLRLRYEGRWCEVDPQVVRRYGQRWFLATQQVGDDAPRQFALSRVSHLRADGPGTFEQGGEHEIAPH